MDPDTPTPYVTCARCGAYAPPSLSACALCEAPHPPIRPEAKLPKGHRWSCLRLTFDCVHCGQRSPIAELREDGVTCTRCQAKQPVKKSDLYELLKEAHDVASFPLDDGAAGMNEDEDTWADVEVDRISAVISPGAPRCDGCQGAVDVEVVPPNVARTTCTRCGLVGSHFMPATVSTAYRRVRGLVSSKNGTAPGRAAPLWLLFEGDAPTQLASKQQQTREARRERRRAAQLEAQKQQNAEKREANAQERAEERKQQEAVKREGHHAWIWMGAPLIATGLFILIPVLSNAERVDVWYSETECTIAQSLPLPGMDGLPAVRVSLEFDAAGAPKKGVEWVSATPNADVPALLQRYAAGTKVPCWYPDDEDHLHQATVFKPTAPFGTKSSVASSTLWLLVGMIGVGVLMILISPFTSFYDWHND